MHAFLKSLVALVRFFSPQLLAKDGARTCELDFRNLTLRESVEEAVQEFGERNGVSVTNVLGRPAKVQMAPGLIDDYLRSIAPDTVEVIHAPNSLGGMGHVAMRVGTETYNIVPPSAEKGPELLRGGDFATTITDPAQGIGGHWGFGATFPATTQQRDAVRGYFESLPDDYYHLLYHNCATVCFGAMVAGGFIPQNHWVTRHPFIAEPMMAPFIAAIAGPVMRPIYNPDSDDTYFSIYWNKVRDRIPRYLQLAPRVFPVLKHFQGPLPRKQNRKSSPK